MPAPCTADQGRGEAVITASAVGDGGEGVTLGTKGVDKVKYYKDF